MATCRRIISDFGSSSLLVHCIQLCRCVKFLHSKSVIHTDLKPSNIFVRALEATATTVDRIELVIADFDCSYLYDKPLINDLFSDHIGTLGFHECLYSRLTTFESAVKKSKYYEAFMNKYKEGYFGVDVFGLGMVFLMMIYRVHIDVVFAHWIKHEISTCSRQQNENIFCSPAHVLLYHSQITPNLYFPVPSADFARLPETNWKRIRHRRVVDDVKAGNIPKALCDLLEKMTNDYDAAQQQRISIDDCITTLQNILLQQQQL